jgi:hypothetical protein
MAFRLPARSRHIIKQTHATEPERCQQAARRKSGLSNDKTWFWHLSAQAAF